MTSEEKQNDISTDLKQIVWDTESLQQKVISIGEGSNNPEVRTRCERVKWLLETARVILQTDPETVGLFPFDRARLFDTRQALIVPPNYIRYALDKALAEYYFRVIPENVLMETKKT